MEHSRLGIRAPISDEMRLILRELENGQMERAELSARLNSERERNRREEESLRQRLERERRLHDSERERWDVAEQTLEQRLAEARERQSALRQALQAKLDELSARLAARERDYARLKTKTHLQDKIAELRSRSDERYALATRRDRGSGEEASEEAKLDMDKTRAGKLDLSVIAEELLNVDRRGLAVQLADSRPLQALRQKQLAKGLFQWEPLNSVLRHFWRPLKGKKPAAVEARSRQNSDHTCIVF